MSEEQVVLYCSPTLAGLKTGSLFACTYERRSEVSKKTASGVCGEASAETGGTQQCTGAVDGQQEGVDAQTSKDLVLASSCGLHTVSEDCREQIVQEFRDYNRDLQPKGLRMIPLQIRNGRVLTYLYRPAELERDFADPDCRNLLNELGYEGLDSEACVVRLRERLQECGSDFPHEIGLFLGYPVEDVRGFIYRGTDRCKCTGHWKVYGNEHEAKKLFAKYDCCTACFLERLANGTELEKLAVAV